MSQNCKKSKVEADIFNVPVNQSINVTLLLSGFSQSYRFSVQKWKMCAMYPNRTGLARAALGARAPPGREKIYGVIYRGKL